MAMFEATKTKNVFKSKWNALFWSASVMFTAYCSIPSDDSAPAPQAAATPAPAAAPTAQADLTGQDRWFKRKTKANVMASAPASTDNSMVVGTDALGQKVTAQDVQKLDAMIHHM